jgi:uncharacterized protein
MQSRLLHQSDGQRTFVVVLETGDEIIASLQEFVSREQIHAATFTAIGALSDALLLYFDWEKKRYQKIPVRERVEVASLIGDVADDPEDKAALNIKAPPYWQRSPRPQPAKRRRKTIAFFGA